MNNNKIKVLIIGHECNLHGASRSMIGLIEALSDKVDFHVLLPYDSGQLYYYLKNKGIKVIVKPYYMWVYWKRSDDDWNKWEKRWQSLHDHKNEGIANELSEYVISEKIDLIHTNVSVVDIGARVSRITGKKHIWHFREFGDLDFGMFPLISNEAYVETIVSYSDVNIFVSKAVSDHYPFIPNRKKVVIYNGISSEMVIPSDEIISHEGINILISGPISDAKQQIIGAKVCGQLVEEGYNIKLYLAGDNGDNKLISDIRKMMPSNLILCGFVDDMRSLRKMIDIEIVCSKSEGFGRVTVESMLAAIPVIGSNSGGTPEIIPNMRCGGLLFEQGNEGDLKEKIELLYEDEHLRKKIGQCGQQRALSMFSMTRCANEVYEQYMKVLG